MFGCIVTIGLVGAADAQNQSDPAPIVSSTTQGRYQIVLGGISRKDNYLLDTQTGRVWGLTSFPDLVGEPQAWKIMDRIDNDADMTLYIQSHGWKPQPKPSPPVGFNAPPPASPPVRLAPH